MNKSDWCAHNQHVACRYAKCGCECHDNSAAISGAIRETIGGDKATPKALATLTGSSPTKAERSRT